MHDKPLVLVILKIHYNGITLLIVSLTYILSLINCTYQIFLALDKYKKKIPSV